MSILLLLAQGVEAAGRTRGRQAMTDIVKGMHEAFINDRRNQWRNGVCPKSDEWEYDNRQSMRAALMFLAENGSEEISVRLCRVFYRIPSTDPVPMPLVDGMTDALKEAIRAAAGGEE
jgi:hypothetical protein